MAYELYNFNNNGLVYAITNSVLSKTLSSVTYTPTVVTRGSINLTDNFKKSPVTFTFPITNTWARTLLQELPEVPILVVIYKDNLVYWQGRVLEVKAQMLTIDVTCDSLYSKLAKQGLQQKATIVCRHTLYDPNTCKVNKASFVANYSVTGVDSAVISIPSISQASEYFNGGIAVLSGQTRYISLHSGTTITLGSPFSGILSGTISLYPGCNLTKAACIGFSNLANHGGFPYIPIKNNPFGSTGAL